RPASTSKNYKLILGKINMKNRIARYTSPTLIFIALLFTSFSCKNSEQQNFTDEKRTILILGGTPSTTDILNEIHDSIKSSYNIISFNRPGFGGTEVSRMSKEKLFKLAKEAGLKENDYGIIGISGGAPLSILLADAFKIKNCGVISGMVSNEAYFQFADSTFTKDFFKDRKSTRLNSSHVKISYAVFCLKKKTKKI